MLQVSGKLFPPSLCFSGCLEPQGWCWDLSLTPSPSSRVHVTHLMSVPLNHCDISLSLLEGSWRIFLRKWWAQLFLGRQVHLTLEVRSPECVGGAVFLLEALGVSLVFPASRSCPIPCSVTPHPSSLCFWYHLLSRREISMLRFEGGSLCRMTKQ